MLPVYNAPDLPSINMDPRLGGTLCGQGLGIRDPEETADEALAHFGGDMGSLPPGETLGGKLGRRSGLPAIRKGMTTISKTEAPLDGAEEALEGLCIGNRRLLDAERSFAEASGSKVCYPMTRAVGSLSHPE